MYRKEKHAMDHKPVILKQAANKQELTNWENILITKNKTKILRYKFLNLVSRSFNKEVHLKSSRGQQISSYKEFKP